MKNDEESKVIMGFLRKEISLKEIEILPTLMFGLEKIKVLLRGKGSANKR
jgi:hypothetical protein